MTPRLSWYGRSGASNLHSRIATCIGAVILGIALAVPISAFASEVEAAPFFADAVAEEGGLRSQPVDKAGIESVAEGDDAAADAAPFDVAGFTRAQKGSNRPIDDVYRGYSYLQGAAPNSVCLVAVDDYAVLYVDDDAFAEITGTQEWRVDVSWAVAYAQTLDAAAANGSSRLEAGMPLIVTAEEVLLLEDKGLRFSFNQEYTPGSFYTSVTALDGSDPDGLAALRYADFFDAVLPGQVAVAAAPSGIAAFGQFLDDLDWSPLWVTLKTTGTAIVIVFILGLLAAWWSLRIPSRAQDIADSIFTIPMVLPPTVCGFVLLLLLGKNTPVGQWFIDIGFPLIFSWPATVLAAVVVSFPLMYRSARGAFESIDRTMLDAARTLGWSEGRIFFKLMLPLAWSSIAAGTVLAFARALGEFGATLFLAGNYVGVTRTVPIAIYFEWMNGNTDVALFWTGVIIVFSFMVILFINLWSRRTTRYRRRTQDA